MIIFGTRGLTSSRGTGSFFCPGCGTETPYARKGVRRWFTLYFIPVLPLDMVGEYVECQHCRGTFKVEALERSAADYLAERQHFQAEFKRAMKDIMILMMLADGKVEANEILQIVQIYGGLAGQDLKADVLRADLERIRQTRPSIEEYCRALAGTLNDHGKAMVYQAALLVATSDGDLAREEEGLLKAIRKALGMSRSDENRIRKELARCA